MQSPASLTVAIVDRDLSEHQLAEMGLQSRPGTVTLEWLERRPLHVRCGVRRVAGHTLLIEGGGHHLGELFGHERIDLPGTWVVGADCGVWIDLRVFRQGRLVRHLQDDSGEFIDSGDPVGDESLFRILDEEGRLDGLDGPRLLAELPRLAGVLERHPDFDIRRVGAQRLTARAPRTPAAAAHSPGQAPKGLLARLLSR